MNYTHAYSLREGAAQLAQPPPAESRMADLGQDELQLLVSDEETDEEILDRAASALAFQQQQVQLALLTCKQKSRSTSGPLDCSNRRRLQFRRQDICRDQPVCAYTDRPCFCPPQDSSPC